MNRHSTKMWLTAVAVIAGGAWAFGLSRAQEAGQIADDLDLATPMGEQPAAGDILPEMGGEPVATTVLDETELRGAPVGWVIRQAAAAVRDAQGEEAKTAAQQTLAALLGRYFDREMARRESELTAIEERLAKLRELHTRRRNKREEIIELQIKVALNEAEGLGFYNDESPGGGADNLFGAPVERSPFDDFQPASSPFPGQSESTGGATAR